MAETLPPADWTKRADLARIADALGAENIRWVGGAVRDTLLGLPVDDVDCATLHHPETVMDRLAGASIRCIPTGIEHGTVTAVQEEGSVEITTLRHDVSTDGRRATVAFANDWREDAARRDFTINALYIHPETLEISDWFGGMADLAARRVRFIGDAHERIREDHLRILRYFRFHARFGAERDDEAAGACRDLAATLKGLSRERVSMELLKLLALPDPTPTVSWMGELGVLDVVLPEAGERGIAALGDLVAAEQSVGIAPDALRRLAALLPALPAVAEGVAVRFRLSRAQRARLASAAGRSTQDCDDPRALAYREGPVEALDRLLLLNCDVAPLADWTPPTFPLKGGEIVARGIMAGPDIARVLRAVEDRWVAEGFPSRHRVMELLNKVLAERS